MYIVAFNGPPRSGKDTMAEMLANHMDKMGVTVPVKFESLSIPLRRIAYEIVGNEGRSLDGPDYEQFKLTPYSLRDDGLAPSSGREIMIDVSERFLKPCYGKSVMARMLLERNKNFKGVLLLRDSGFQCEVDPLIEQVGVENFYVAQVHRDGTSFDGDSREWVTHSNMAVYENNSHFGALATEAGRIYGRLVNQLGWKL